MPAPIKKTIIALKQATEDSLVRLLTNQPAAAGGQPPFPDDLGGGKSASQKHQEFLEALLSGDPAEVDNALRNLPSSQQITDDAEVARVIHIVQSLFQAPGGANSLGLRVYLKVKQLIAAGGAGGPDPTFW
jgi:hypothetical protein